MPSSAALTMLDHNDASIDALPGAEMRELASGCRAAADEWLQRRPGETVPLESRIEPPVPHATPRGDAVSIAYLVMAHRRFAHATVARALKALWAPEHLFLLHFDVRANASAVSWLRGKLESAPNVRFMSHRRAVGWGAFSMVEVLLEAMAAALRSVFLTVALTLTRTLLLPRTLALTPNLVLVLALALTLTLTPTVTAARLRLPHQPERRRPAPAHGRRVGRLPRSGLANPGPNPSLTP